MKILEKEIKQNLLERKYFQTIFIGVEKLMSVINGTHNAPFVTFSYEWFSQLSSKINEQNSFPASFALHLLFLGDRVSRVIGGFTLNLNQPPQIFTKDKVFYPLQLSRVSCERGEGRVRKGEADSSARLLSTTQNNDCHLLRGSSALILKGLLLPHDHQTCLDLNFICVRSIWDTDTGDKAINIIYIDSMGSRVLLLLMLSDDGDGFKVNWSQSINSSHESRPGGTLSLSLPPPPSSVPAIVCPRRFPAKALREEPGLIDSDILFPILFSYLFHTLKVFPPLYSRSSQKPNRLWLYYLDKTTTFVDRYIVSCEAVCESLNSVMTYILRKFTFAWVAISNKMALLQSEYMQNFIDPPIEQTGGCWQCTNPPPTPGNWYHYNPLRKQKQIAIKSTQCTRPGEERYNFAAPCVFVML